MLIKPKQNETKISGLIIIAAAIISSLFFNACENLDKLTEITFGYTYKSDTFPVPAIPSAGDVDLSV